MLFWFLVNDDEDQETLSGTMLGPVDVVVVVAADAVVAGAITAAVCVCRTAGAGDGVA